MMKTDIYFCSFADSRMLPSLIRIGRQAEEFGIFKNIFLWNEYDFDVEFKGQFQDKLLRGSRGYGYWVWKPYVIQKALKNIPEGTILLYLDAGCHLNKEGMSKFNEYISVVKDSLSGILVSELTNDYIEKYYTKGDVFDFFKVRDVLSITDTPQRQGGVIFIRKTKENEQMIHDWLSVFYGSFHLVDDTISLCPNFEGFVENRHDQSIWSILTKLRGVNLFSSLELSPTIENPIWAIRDKTIKLRYRYSLKRFVKKMMKRIGL